MLRPSAFFGLIVLAVAIGQQVPVLLISHSLGVVAVAVFATSRTLTGLVRQFVSLLSSATWTDLTRLETQGDTERLSSALRILVATSMIAVVSLAGILWFDVAAILAFWTNGRIVADLGLLQLMLLHLVVQTLWMSASNVPAATNRHRSLAISYIASNVIAVALSALLLPSLGLNAIPLSFIAADLMACYHFVIRDACRISAIPYAGYMIKIVTGSVAMIAGVWAVALAVHAAIPGAIVARLTTLSLLLPPIVASVAWFFLLMAEDRQRVAAWKGRMLLRRRFSEPAR